MLFLCALFFFFFLIHSLCSSSIHLGWLASKLQEYVCFDSTPTSWGCHVSCPVFTWVLWIQTPIFILVWQARNGLSQLPSLSSSEIYTHTPRLHIISIWFLHFFKISLLEAHVTYINKLIIMSSSGEKHSRFRQANTTAHTF